MSAHSTAPRRPADRLPRTGGRPVLLEGAALALLTAIALALRAGQLHQTLVADEVLAYNEIAGHSLGQTLHLVHTGVESSPPLFFVIAWLSAKLGDPTVWIRLPSLVLGAATVPVVYATGRELAGRTAGLIGAAIIAVAPFAVFYGIEARPYATMTFFVALSTLALLKGVRTGSVRWWAVYALAAAAAAYAHYTCVFVLAAQGLWSLWATRENPRRALIAGAAIVLLYLPWVPQLHGEYLQVYAKLYPLGVQRVLTDLVRPIAGHPGAPLRAIPTLAGVVVVGLVGLGGLSITAVRGWRDGEQWKGRRLDSARTLLAWLVLATPVGLLLYSLLVTDLWLPRNLSASLPATALALGVLVAALPRPAALLAGVAVLTTLFAGTLRSFEPTFNRGPYRTIAGYLDRFAGPHDPVSLQTFVGAGALRAEFRRPHRVLSRGAMWRALGPRATGYLVLDAVIARRLAINPAPPPGFTLVARRHYPGALSTDVLSYRRARGGG